jgi:hypothetical protein
MPQSAYSITAADMQAEKVKKVTKVTMLNREGVELFPEQKGSKVIRQRPDYVRRTRGRSPLKFGVPSASLLDRPKENQQEEIEKTEKKNA